MKKILSTIIFFLATFLASATEWVSFGRGEECERYASLFIIEYPSDFFFSPKSMIFPVDYKGPRARYEPPHILVLESEKRAFHIVALPLWGNFISPETARELTVEETIDFVKKGIVSPTIERREHCTLVHGVAGGSGSRTVYEAYFVENDVPEGCGVMVQRVRFVYDTRVSQIDPVIMEIISRFKSIWDRDDME